MDINPHVLLVGTPGQRLLHCTACLKYQVDKRRAEPHRELNAYPLPIGARFS